MRADTKQRLMNASTATLTTILFKKGMRNVWIRGAMPLTPGMKRVVGPAFTMRFIPYREDQATPAAWESPTSTRHAVEAVEEGDVVVVDALGTPDAGVFGDILCQRLQVRGAAGVITDGVLRDRIGIDSTGLPAWCSGVAAPAAVSQLIFAGWQQHIGCGGVAIFPGDILVADEDGAIVIPPDMVDEVAALAYEQEQQEEWVMNRVIEGEPLPGLYPMNEKNAERYRKSRENRPSNNMEK